MDKDGGVMETNESATYDELLERARAERLDLLRFKWGFRLWKRGSVSETWTRNSNPHRYCDGGPNYTYQRKGA